MFLSLSQQLEGRAITTPPPPYPGRPFQPFPHQFTFLNLSRICMAFFPLEKQKQNKWDRLLALLALAFRSHQFYFSHAHDVTQTLQSLRISSSSSPTISSSSSSSEEDEASTHLRKPSSKAGLNDNKTGHSNETHNSTLLKRSTASNSEKGGRRRRGWLNRSIPSKKEASSETAAKKKNAPDARFFWNLGVLSSLLDLRDRISMAEEDGSGKGEEINGEGGTPPTKGLAAVKEGEQGRRGVDAVDRWLTPVMSGFLQVERNCRVGDRGFDVLFVSRRSRLRQGTRFTRRGIDDGGNVANFVETEQARAFFFFFFSSRCWERWDGLCSRGLCIYIVYMYFMAALGLPVFVLALDRARCVQSRKVNSTAVGNFGGQDWMGDE